MVDSSLFGVRGATGDFVAAPPVGPSNTPPAGATPVNAAAAAAIAGAGLPRNGVVSGWDSCSGEPSESVAPSVMRARREGFAVRRRRQVKRPQHQADSTAVRLSASAEGGARGVTRLSRSWMKLEGICEGVGSGSGGGGGSGGRAAAMAAAARPASASW